MSRKFQNHRARHAVRKAGLRLSRGVVAASFGALVVVFGVGYLLQVNATSSKGFQIRELESRLSDLKERGEKLELKVAQEQSVASVEQKVKDMGMVPTPQVQYVTTAAPVVAKR